MTNLMLKRGTDQVIRLPKLRLATIPPTYLNTALVTATLVDPHGEDLAAYTDVVMAHVDDSDGVYERQLDGATFMVPPSTRYGLRVVAVQDSYNFRTVCNVTVVD